MAPNCGWVDTWKKRVNLKERRIANTQINAENGHNWPQSEQDGVSGNLFDV